MHMGCKQKLMEFSQSLISPNLGTHLMCVLRFFECCINILSLFRCQFD